MARFLTIDWDQNQLHLAETNISGTNVKVLRAVVTTEEQSPLTGDPEALGKILRERLKAAGISGAPVLACVGRDRVILKDLRFPSVPAHEEPALVRFQSMKELSEAPEDVVIDFTSTKDGIENGDTRALALIVKRDVLQSYQKICAAAGLKLAGLTPRALGLSACLRRIVGTTTLTPAPDPVDAAVAIVTVADKWAEFCVIRGKQLLLARSMATGANMAGEVRRNLALYAGQNAQNPVKAVYLAGSGIAAVRDRLTEMVEVPLYSFDPFGGVERPELPIGQRGSFAGAIGLAYARAEKGGLPINFVQPREPKPPASPTRFRGLVAALLLIAVLGGLFVLSQSLQAQANQRLAIIKTKLSEEDAIVKEKREEMKRLEAMDTWEVPVWIDELYNLTAAIQDVNTLRVTNVAMEAVNTNTKSPYTAKMTIKGYMTTRGDQTPVQRLSDTLEKDQHYKVDPYKITTGTTFTLVVNIKRRPRTEYSSIITGGP